MKRGYVATLAWQIVVVSCMTLTAGCVTFTRDPLPMADPTVSRVWPAPPEQPRIRFLRAIEGPKSVIPWSSSIQKLVEVMTGDAAEPLSFHSPAGIASNGGSVIYIADTGARLIHQYDLSQRIVSYITHAGDIPFVSPVGVAVDPAGNLYVTDSVLAKVFKFSKEGDFLAEVGKGEVLLQRPGGIAIDRTGEKYLVDVVAHKLILFSKDDRLRGEFPLPEQQQRLNRPLNVALGTEGEVYVTDAMNFRVAVFDRDGMYIRDIGRIGDAPGSFARPKGVAVDSDGHVYIVDANFDNFQVFDKEGRLLMYVGKTGAGPGEFYLPNGIFIDRNDRIFVTDTYNHRIQIFQYLKEGNK